MSDNQESVLDVEGMSCASCVRHVDEALRGLDGVQRVEVQLQSGTAHVFHDASRAPVAALLRAVKDAGYFARVSGPP